MITFSGENFILRKLRNFNKTFRKDLAFDNI